MVPHKSLNPAPQDVMKILRLLSVRGFIVAIYCSKDRQYQFDIIDPTGKYYISPDSFFHLITAREKAFSLIDQAINEIEHRKAKD